jgi:hypothetical protein
MYYKSFQETASVKEKCIVQISMFCPKYSKTSLTQHAQKWKIGVQIMQFFSEDVACKLGSWSPTIML